MEPRNIQMELPNCQIDLDKVVGINIPLSDNEENLIEFTGVPGVLTSVDKVDELKDEIKVINSRLNCLEKKNFKPHYKITSIKID